MALQCSSAAAAADHKNHQDQNKRKMSLNQVDVLLSKIGTGRWNFVHGLTTGFASGLPAAHALAGAFVVPRLEHTCRTKAGVLLDPNLNSTNFNFTNSCSYIIKTDDGGSREELCTEWDFDNTFSRTITSELDIVCEKNYVRALYMSLYMVGVLVASPTFGYLADRYGRKTTFSAGVIGFIFLSLLSGWLPNISAILACRFLIGIMHVSVVKISYILGMESFSPDVRSTAGILLYFPWTIYAIFFSVLAYLIRDWRWLITVASLPSLLLLPGLWFLDESSHWLTVKGRHNKALQVIKKAARWNKAELPSDDEIVYLLKFNSSVAPLAKQEEEERESCQSILVRNIKDLFILFRTPRLRIISAVMHLDFFVIDMVYYGLAFSGGNFDIDIYSYMILIGVMEIPSRTITCPIVARFGRKIPLVASLIMSGVVLLCIAPVPSDMTWLIVTFAMLGRMCICMASAVNYLYGSELFPTEVRTRGISYSFMMSRIGSSIAPFITEYLGQAYPWAPSVVFGGLSVVAGLATMVLWDTHGLTLPDTIAFLENNDPRAGAKMVRKKGRNGSIPKNIKRDGDHPEEQVKLNRLLK